MGRILKILHIINSFDQSGAELSLLNLVKFDNSNQHCVVALKRRGSLLNEFKDYDLGSFSSFVFSLFSVQKQSRQFHVIQGWLSWGIISAVLVHLIFCRSSFLVASFRNSKPKKIGELLRVYCIKILSKIVDMNGIFVSNASRQYYAVDLNLNLKKSAIIYNGIRSFCFWPRSRKDCLISIRLVENISEGRVLVFFGRNGDNKNIDFLKLVARSFAERSSEPVTLVLL